MSEIKVGNNGRCFFETEPLGNNVMLRRIVLDKGIFSVAAWRGVKGRTNYDTVEVEGVHFSPCILRLVDYLPMNEETTKWLATRVVLEYKAEVKGAIQTLIGQSSKVDWLSSSDIDEECTTI
jgi:hypothetical protein